jgi:large subunit ribosomal protein L24
MKIKKGDTVLVVTGKSKKQKGTVTQVLLKEEKVVVEGVNLASTWKKDPNGQSVAFHKAQPIHVSNVALIDPKSGKPTRVGITKTDGKRSRVAKKSGAVIA